jgi:predicted DNA-binding protein with PD1-like motif
MELSVYPVQPGKSYMGRLPHGADLLESLTAFCVENAVRLGKIEGLGAVQKARIGYFNQKTRKYQFNDIDKAMEITALIGNVSLKDGKPMVHAHVTLADENGNAVGGHLASGTVIYACEIVVQAQEGLVLERGSDPETGLPLWKRSV